MAITSNLIHKFWKSFSEETRNLYRTSNPIIFVGNGISRLAKTTNPSLSWHGWIQDCWKQVEPPIPFEYAMLRGLSLPECITYLIEYVNEAKKHKSDEKLREKHKIIYHTLWKINEKNAQPDLIHYAIADRFNTIVTTNYDTLIERACKEHDYKTSVIVIGAINPSDQPHFFEGRNPSKLIIKLHGSFPLDWIENLPFPPDETFDAWFNKNQGEDLIASIRGYRSRDENTREVAIKVFKQNRLRGLPIIILGYGMASEDDLVIELLNRQLDSNIKVAMTYGGDEIDNYRFQNQWGIKHLLIPGNQGGGINARINAHLQFINQFTLGDCKDSGTTENCDNFDTDRALLIGQSSYQYVVRLETAPLQERTYQVLSGKFNVKDKDEQAYEVKQVGGQMFVPAKFLSHWGVPVSLGSVIGYDEFGMEIRRQLYELDNIDWRYTEMASEIVTDHSYVVTFAGVRTIIDGRAGIKDSRIADRFIKRINEDLSSGQLTPKVIYLSKWYLESCKSILSKSNSTKGLKPLIAYETGTRGSEDPQSYEGSILGDSCDVVLSSSLFAMRIARLPLSSPETRKIGYKTDDTTTIAQWDSQFKNYQPKNTTNKTYQNDALAIGLKNVGCIKFHERLFSSIFPNASWWVITMGEGGMILFNRSCPSYGTWIPSPKVDVVNALGCGDVSRAGFITWFMKSGLNREEFLNSEKAVITAAKFAVAAGSYKTEYFSIDTAAQYLTWDYLTEKVLSLTETRLNDEQSIEKLGTALS